MAEQDIFLDISGWNLYKYQPTSMALFANRANLTIPEIIPDEHSTNMREWSRVPIGSTASKRTFFTSTALSGLVYVEPDFKMMYEKDPRHPQAVGIKAAHGTAGPGASDQYPIDDYLRPARAALNAGWGFWPYHFYYMDMNSRDQASCLYQSINAGIGPGGDKRLFGTGAPMVDLEDTKSQMYRSFSYTLGDSISLSRAIANCKYFLGTVFKLYLTEIERLWSTQLGRDVLCVIYSGSWVWKPMIDLLSFKNPNTGDYYDEHKAIFDFYAPRLAINAWYTNDHLPTPLTENQKMGHIINVARQYTSTAVPPMIGLNVPGRDGVLGSSLDLNLYLGNEYEKFMGVKRIVTPPPLPPPPPPPTDYVTREEFEKLKSWGINLGYKE